MTLMIKLRDNAQNPFVHAAITQQILIGPAVMYQGKNLQHKILIEQRVLFTIHPAKKKKKKL